MTGPGIDKAALIDSLLEQIASGDFVICKTRCWACMLQQCPGGPHGRARNPPGGAGTQPTKEPAMTRIYVAGPISFDGAASKAEIRENIKAFHEAAAALRGLGHHVENPAENNGCDHLRWLDWMRMSVQQIARVDALAMLPRWQESRGAQVEAVLAAGLGLDVRSIEEWLS